MLKSRRVQVCLAMFTVLTLGLVPALAFVPAITITPLPAALYGRQSVVLQGSIGKICRDHPVHLSIKTGSAFHIVGQATVNAKNRWSFTTRVPNTASAVIYQASCGAHYTASIVRKVNRTAAITYSGPGRRILGLDISRWQHITGQTIDFQRMADAGISFVIIKASDGYGPEDQIARKYVLSDARRAKAAGLLVGYYHMISVPTGNARNTLIASANRQAFLVNQRLKQLGGYDVRTLPFTIDVEGINSSISQKSLELWTRTLVTAVSQKTGRTPMLYSYRSLLASRYGKSPDNVAFLRTMHLWLAQPGNPADPAVQVGQFRQTDGSCFHTAWATTKCRTVWTLWQYTSLGNRDTYGIPWSPQRGSHCPSQAKYCVPGIGTGPHHLDMDVFNGTSKDLESLAAGKWNRLPSDFLEPSTTPSPNGTP